MTKRNTMTQAEKAKAYDDADRRADKLGYPTVSHALDALDEGAAHEPETSK